jgi:hypothetical protein
MKESTHPRLTGMEYFGLAMMAKVCSRHWIALLCLRFNPLQNLGF